MEYTKNSTPVQNKVQAVEKLKYAFLTTDDLKRALPPGSTELTPPAVCTMSAISVEHDYF